MAQMTETNNGVCDTPSSSFIKIKESGINGVLGAYIQSERNSTNLRSTRQRTFSSPTEIAQALNRGEHIEPMLIDHNIGQLWLDINKRLQLVGILEQGKCNQVSQEVAPLNPFLGMGQTPKAGNIFAPKPLHVASRADNGRIGRSHSMYVTNPVKPDVSTGDKSNGSEKQSEVVSQSSEKKTPSDGNNRKRMNVFRCPHTDRKHYAKNMCNNCYHKQGRNTKATKCPHPDRQNYAKGKCQNCYLNDYHKIKRRQKKAQSKKQAVAGDDADRRISVETANTEDKEDNKASALAVAQI
jgi:hypothetical protein